MTLVYRQSGGSVVQAIARTSVGDIFAISDWWRKHGVSILVLCFETVADMRMTRNRRDINGKMSNFSFVF